MVWSIMLLCRARLKDPYERRSNQHDELYRKSREFVLSGLTALFHFSNIVEPAVGHSWERRTQVQDQRAKQTSFSRPVSDLTIKPQT